MKYIDTLELSDKTVLLRLNLNVPVDNGKIVDDYRIKAVLPTIQYCRDNARKVVIMAHMGRPKGKRDPKLSLKPVGDYLENIYKEGSAFLTDCIGDDVKKSVQVAADGAVILLENLRFHKEETDNDPEFGRALSELGDVFVNDAFGDSAKENASVIWPATLLDAAAGFRMKFELENLKKIKDNPATPFVIVIGGAKISEKMGTITALGKKADKILIGGAIANTMLAAQGVDVKSSFYQKDELGLAKELLNTYADKLVLPGDAVVAAKKHDAYDPLSLRECSVHELNEGEAILDLGEETMHHFQEMCQEAQTIFWAGPLGYIELEQTAMASIKLAEFLASLNTYVAVGGGETVSAINMAGVIDQIDFVSTGGGAALKYLSGEKLPGLELLN